MKKTCFDCGESVSDNIFHYCAKKDAAKEELLKMMMDKVLAKQVSATVKSDPPTTSISGHSVSSLVYKDEAYDFGASVPKYYSSWNGETYPTPKPPGYYKCHLCNYAFPGDYELKSHMTYAHPPAQPTQQKCYVCSATMPQNTYDMHMQMHWTQKADAGMVGMLQTKVTTLEDQVAVLMATVEKLKEEVKNIDKPIVKSLF